MHSRFDLTLEKYRLKRIGRTHRDVGVLHSLFGGTHWHHFYAECLTHLARKLLSVCLIGTEAADGFDIAYSAGGYELRSSLSTRS